MIRRRLVVPALAAGALCALAAPALAWVTLTKQVDVDTTAGELGQPTELTTHAQGADLEDSRVRLSWHAPGGVPATGYRIQRQAVGSGTWSEIIPADGPTCTGSDCSAVDVHGSPGTSFRYRVTATRHSWAGPVSDQRLSASVTPSTTLVDTDTGDLSGVSVGSGGLAVGAGGTIRGCLGGCTSDTNLEWLLQPRPSAADLSAVSVVDASDAWAVGDGVAWHCTDDCFDTSAAWSPDVTVAGPLVLEAAVGVAATGDGYLAVVTPHHFNFTLGSVWANGTAQVHSPSTTLLSVAAADGRHVIVTATDGYSVLCSMDSPALTGMCGGPFGTFTYEPTPGDFRSVTWDEGDSAYVAVDTAGHLWRRASAQPGTPWLADDADAAGGKPADIRSIAARTAGNVSRMWAVAGAVGARRIWHFDGSAWFQQPLTEDVDPTGLSDEDGGFVLVPSRTGALPSTCQAPALRTTVDVPAGPGADVHPKVSARLTYGSGAVNQAQVLVSTDGTSWSSPQPIDTAAAADTVAFSDIDWDTTQTQTVHVCVMARGGSGLALDAIRLGIQQ